MRLSSCDPACTPYHAYQRPACPRCGDTLFAAAATEFLGQGRIRNTWSCDSCDFEFWTAVALPSER